MRIEDIYIAELIKDGKNRKTYKNAIQRKKDAYRDRVIEMISSISNRMRD